VGQRAPLGGGKAGARCVSILHPAPYWLRFTCATPVLVKKLKVGTRPGLQALGGIDEAAHAAAAACEPAWEEAKRLAAELQLARARERASLVSSGNRPPAMCGD
jgi:hypothetical protein